MSEDGKVRAMTPVEAAQAEAERTLATSLARATGAVVETWSTGDGVVHASIGGRELSAEELAKLYPSPAGQPHEDCHCHCHCENDE
jgi:hypothetical protein